MKSARIAICLSIALCCLWACAPRAKVGGAEPAAMAEAAEATALPMEITTPEPTAAPVLVNGQPVLPDCRELTLEGALSLPAALHMELEQLPQLRAVSLTRAVPQDQLFAWTEAWAELEATLPQISFTYGDVFDGASAQDVTAFAVTDLTEDWDEELGAILSTFENLAQLDLTAVSPARETVAATMQKAPEIRVLWTDETFGPSQSDETTVTLSGPVGAQEAKAYLACFPGLREADLRACAFTEAEGDALCAAFPQVAFRRMVTLNEEEYDSFVQELDLTGVVIQDPDAFGAALGRFPKVSKVDLSDCSLSNETLAQLRDRYPQAGIVWTVRFGHWSCRTDAVAFSTQQDGYNTHRQNARNVAVLQYCTELLALDLGHNVIEDVSWLEPLQKLQVLILADNGLKDISPLASLKRLKFVELFMNPIKDISALTGMEELLDVNLCVTYVKDLSPLLSCKKLERIWLGHQTCQYITKESLQAVQEAFPQAEYDLLSVSCTNRGWREHDRYFAYREMFKNNVPVAPFLPEE